MSRAATSTDASAGDICASSADHSANTGLIRSYVPQSRFRSDTRMGQSMRGRRSSQVTGDELTAPSVTDPATDPVDQLDCAVEIIDRVARTLPAAIPDREELIALAGVLTQLSKALHTLTDRLTSPVCNHDRTRTPAHGNPPLRSRAVAPLSDCRSSFAGACMSARALHAALKR